MYNLFLKAYPCLGSTHIHSGLIGLLGVGVGTVFFFFCFSFQKYSSRGSIMSKLRSTVKVNWGINSAPFIGRMY